LCVYVCVCWVCVLCMCLARPMCWAGSGAGVLVWRNRTHPTHHRSPRLCGLLQAVYRACCAGTLSPLTVPLANEACREGVTADFASLAAEDTAITSAVDVDLLAARVPTEVGHCWVHGEDWWVGRWDGGEGRG
jgi:hypothetical protein